MQGLLGLGALALIGLLGAAACTYAPRYDDPGDWRHEYYYYPDIGVYFHLYSGDYFYRDDRNWKRVKFLPRPYLLDRRFRRTLIIQDDVPYRQHLSHRERFRVWSDVKYDRRHDQEEREHNRERHLEYRRDRDHPLVRPR